MEINAHTHDNDSLLRKQELQATLDKVDGAGAIVGPLIDDAVFLESQLDMLRKLPLIRVNPADSSQQKATPAAKIYREMLQQYNNVIKTLAGILSRAAEQDEDTPLRAYLKSRGQAGRRPGSGYIGKFAPPLFKTALGDYSRR